MGLIDTVESSPWGSVERSGSLKSHHRTATAMLPLSRCGHRSGDRAERTCCPSEIVAGEVGTMEGGVDIGLGRRARKGSYASTAAGRGKAGLASHRTRHQWFHWESFGEDDVRISAGFEGLMRRLAKGRAMSGWERTTDVARRYPVRLGGRRGKEQAVAKARRLREDRGEWEMAPRGGASGIGVACPAGGGRARKNGTTPKATRGSRGAICHVKSCHAKSSRVESSRIESNRCHGLRFRPWLASSPAGIWG